MLAFTGSGNTRSADNSNSGKVIAGKILLAPKLEKYDDDVASASVLYGVAMWENTGFCSTKLLAPSTGRV